MNHQNTPSIRKRVAALLCAAAIFLGVLPWDGLVLAAQAAGELTVNLSSTEAEYTGSDITIEIDSVMDGDTALDTADYEVSPSTVQDADTYEITVSGKNDYADKTGTASFTVTPKEISPESVQLSPESTACTGEPQIPLVSVEGLTEDVDFEVNYGEAGYTDAGAYTVVVTGKGNYITDTPIEKTYTITQGTPTLTATDIDSLPYGSQSLFAVECSSDGALTYTVESGSDIVSLIDMEGRQGCEALKPGTAVIRVESAETANFAAASASFTVTVVPAVVTAAVDETAALTYNGENQLPSVQVMFGETALSEITDFTVTCADADYSAAGNHTTVVTLIGEAAENYVFAGDMATCSLTYTIRKALAVVAVSGSFPYENAEIEPDDTMVTVTGADNTVLSSGTDYSAAFTYENNLNVSADGSSAKVKVAMLNPNYESIAEGEFTIEPKDISDEVMVSVAAGPHYYTGSEVTPEITVTWKDDSPCAGWSLLSGTDYTVAFSNHTEVSTESSPASVTVTFNGNYTGSATESFSVEFFQNAKTIDSFSSAMSSFQPLDGNDAAFTLSSTPARAGNSGDYWLTTNSLTISAPSGYKLRTADASGSDTDFITYGDLVEGSNNLQFRVVDTANSAASDIMTLEVKVDTTLPTMGSVTVSHNNTAASLRESVTEYPDGAIACKNENITITLADGSDDASGSGFLDAYVVAVDTPAADEAAVKALFDDLTGKSNTAVVSADNTRHYVYAMFRDNAGNRNYYSLNGTVLKDVDYPTATVSVSSAENKQSSSLEFSFSDTTSGIRSISAALYDGNEIYVNSLMGYSHQPTAFILNTTATAYDTANADNTSYQTITGTISIDKPGSFLRVLFKVEDQAGNVAWFDHTGAVVAENAFDSFNPATDTAFCNTRASSTQHIYFEYDNNTCKHYTSDAAGEQDYFNADRTLTVTVNNLMAPSVTLTLDGISTTCPGNYSYTGHYYEYSIDPHVFSVDAIHNADAQATDPAGQTIAAAPVNSSQKAINGFVLDKTAPQFTLSQIGSYNHYKNDGDYYKAAFTLKAELAETNFNASELTAKLTLSGSDTALTADANQTFSVTIDPASYADGRYTITVQGEDKAGNGIVVVDNTCTDAEKCHNNILSGNSYTTGEKILDTAAPVASVSYESTAAPCRYDLTDYYNSAVTVKVTVNDINLRDDQVFGSLGFKAAAVADDNAREPGLAHTVAALSGTATAVSMEKATTDDGVYALKLYGTDKAGNALKVRGDSSNGSYGAEAAAYVSGNKVVDTAAPMATITYDNSGYLYGDMTAYYNTDTTVSFLVTDTLGNNIANTLDGDKVQYAAIEQNYTAVDKAVSDDATREFAVASADYTAFSAGSTGQSTLSNTKVMNAEKVYGYAIYGTDKAGNALNVTEIIQTLNKTTATPESDTVKSAPSANVQDSAYITGNKVVDKTSPVVSFTVTPDSSVTNKAFNAAYNRYFFNNKFDAEFVITETNYDADRIDRHYLSQSYRDAAGKAENAAVLAFTSTAPIMLSADSAIGNVITNSIQLQDEGMYHFILNGTDKAGNRVSVTTVTDSSFDLNLPGEFISRVIVVDKTAPKATMTISYTAEAAAYYTMSNEGNLSGTINPYRSETSAHIHFSTDDEATPTTLSYTVATMQLTDEAGYDGYKPVSTIGQSVASTTNLPASDYVLPEGQQIFRVENWSMTDLAGNAQSLAYSNNIFLDVKAADKDTLAPTVSVTATSTADSYIASGIPLFKDSVPLRVKVVDPNPISSSAGLKEVSYKLFIGSSVAETGTLLTYDGSYTTIAGGVDKQKGLIFSLDKTVTADKAKFNHNDVRMAVTAVDNAGNTSTYEYLLGIDITAPAIQVSYNNNNAMNERYFAQTRTATIVVTERNFDPGNTPIETNGDIGGWSCTNSGTGNGDDRQWTCNVGFTADGEYHFNTSTTDLLGWTAAADYGSSVAPLNFIIDMTRPTVRLDFDNNNVYNGRYYNADRNATITVTDVNFDGTSNITVTANPGAPGSFAFNGHVAGCNFHADGVYGISGTVTDMAGNISDEFHCDEFVIDQTSPELLITGVENLSANRDPVNVVLSMTDTNIDLESIHATLSGTNNGETDISGKRAYIEGGVSYTLDPIDQDDYYRLVFVGTDLANNSVEETISFSENQNGTVFVFNQPEIVNGYTNTPFHPSVSLYDVDEVTILSVTLNGKDVAYDYTNNIVTLTDELNADGKYSLTMDTVDAAENYNSMEPVEFFFDGTAPILTVNGLEDGKYYFKAFEFTLIQDNPRDHFALLTLDGVSLTEGDYVDNGNGSITIPVNDFAKHRLVAQLADEAGNTSETVDYTFTLTNNLFIRFYQTKPVFYGTIATATALAAGWFIFGGKRRSLHEDNALV